jgi:hypothetical protein
MTPAKSKSKSAPKSNAGLTAAFLLLAVGVAGYLLWPKPAESVAPTVAARPAPVAPPPAVKPLPEPFVDFSEPTPEPPAPSPFDDPQIREMMRARAEATVDFAYQGLFEQLNLTAEQSENLRGVLADRTAAFTEAMFTQFANGGGPGAFDPTAFMQINAQVDAKFAGSIANAVGQENYQEVKSYNDTLIQTFMTGGGAGFGGGGAGGFGGGGFGAPGN